MSARPVARIGSAVVLALGVATAPLTTALSRVALGVLVLGVLALTRPPLRAALLRVGGAALGLGILLVPFLVMSPARALEVGARALGVVCLVTALVSSVPLARLGPALAGLGVPKALSSTVRALLWQLEHVAGEGRRLLLARRLRGAERFGPEVIAQLVVRTAARAERVDLAMRLRGAELGAADDALAPGDVAWMLGALALAVGLHWIAR